MTANAIDTLRQIVSDLPDEFEVWSREWTASEAETKGLDALARVDTLLRAAKALTNYDFAATQWIAGLRHDGHELRAIHAEDVENLKREVAALAAAVRAVETGQ